jgi:hypothetical protein
MQSKNIKIKGIGFMTLLVVVVLGCNSGYYKNIHLEFDAQTGVLHLVEPDYTIDSLFLESEPGSNFTLVLRDSSLARSAINLGQHNDGYHAQGAMPKFPNRTQSGLEVFASNRATGDLCVFSIRIIPCAKKIVVQEQGRPISRD